MTILHIVKYGDPVLRKKAQPVTEMTPELSRLIDDMLETMYAAPGVGLAAPQVGVSLRLFVADPFYREDKKKTRKPMAFINPEILEESVEDEEMEEGCLSMPGVNADIFRPVRVKARALDRNMKPFEIDSDELIARVIQHELDHLDGLFFTDRLPESKRVPLLPKLNLVKRIAEEDAAELASAGSPPHPATGVARAAMRLEA